MQTSPLKFLPLILAALALGSAVFFFTQRQAVREKINKIYTKLPEPTPFIPVRRFQDQVAVNLTPSITPTPTPTPTTEPTPIPGTVEKTIESVKKTTSVTSKTTTTIVCTPVYGMANSCAEHTVVDTGLETGAFTNLAVLSYVGGLAAFIKAKKRA